MDDGSDSEEELAAFCPKVTAAAEYNKLTVLCGHVVSGHVSSTL